MEVVGVDLSAMIVNLAREYVPRRSINWTLPTCNPVARGPRSVPCDCGVLLAADTSTSGDSPRATGTPSSARSGGLFGLSMMEADIARVLRIYCGDS
ncbi:hypothetical protein [Sinorhizobium sp. 8-89]|uniref:hypothetical protein n=1 Tax=Sinorhizobium sp. 8-89 TaxID=3049089 RepID=UPI00386AD01B